MLVVVVARLFVVHAHGQVTASNQVIQGFSSKARNLRLEAVQTMSFSYAPELYVS